MEVLGLDESNCSVEFIGWKDEQTGCNVSFPVVMGFKVCEGFF